MALPALFAAGQVRALHDEPHAEQTPTRSIFYVTDRVPVQQRDSIDYTRNRSDTVEVGRVNIRFGKHNRTTWDDIAANASGQATDALPRPELLGVQRFGILDLPYTHLPSPSLSPSHPASQAPPTEPANDRFIAELNAAVQRSAGKAITLFFHGFNNDFRKPALTAAEYELITGGLGPFILYSWPSYNSLFEYSYDRDSVRFTSGHARKLIELLASEINAGRLDAERIHILAHSSGAEIVGSVIRELGLLSRGQTPEQRQDTYRLGTIAMVSPDVSADVARERLLQEDIAGLYRRLVVYTSRKDRALQYSSNILYRATRIGALRESELIDSDRRWLNLASLVTIIDADSYDYDSLLRHSHHRYSPAVASDIVLSLRDDLTPAQRGLVRKEGNILWRFPDDYDDRITEAAMRAYPHDPLDDSP